MSIYRVRAVTPSCRTQAPTYEVYNHDTGKPAGVYAHYHEAIAEAVLRNGLRPRATVRRRQA